jgi:SH3-like domain-containing protein
MPIPKHVLLIAVLLFADMTVLAAPGDVLYVKGNNVRVRAAPGLKAAILRQVHYGHVVIEIQRQGEWVKVSLSQSNGTIGWIHTSLVQDVQ